MNVISVMQSGTPFTITNASARSNTDEGDRPNQIGDSKLPESERIVTLWFNTAAFEAQPLNTLGNVGLNTLYGAGLMTWISPLFKSFRTGAGTTAVSYRDVQPVQPGELR